MREDVYRVVKAFSEKKVTLEPEAQRFVDRVVSTCSLDHAFMLHLGYACFVMYGINAMDIMWCRLEIMKGWA